MNQINLCGKRFAFCRTCGKSLGEYKKYCAQDHLKKYPDHNDFVVITIKDPLKMKNPDQWFKSQKIMPEQIDPTKVYSRKTDKDLTEP